MNPALEEDSHIVSRILIRYLDLHIHQISKEQAVKIAEVMRILDNIGEEPDTSLEQIQEGE